MTKDIDIRNRAHCSKLSKNSKYEKRNRANCSKTVLNDQT